MSKVEIIFDYNNYLTYFQLVIRKKQSEISTIVKY